MLWSIFDQSQPEFIRWQQVKSITLYTNRGKGRARLKTPVIEIWCPRRAHHTITRRTITTWTLDRDRLAAIKAAAAPDVTISERART
jgi:hypothetical protein